MTSQEQANLDRVFGRIHVKSPTGALRPLVPFPPVPAPVVETSKPPEEDPTVKKVAFVPKVAPKYEKSPMLDYMLKTFPPPSEVKTKQVPADPSATTP